MEALERHQTRADRQCESRWPDREIDDAGSEFALHESKRGSFPSKISNEAIENKVEYMLDDISDIFQAFGHIVVHDFDADMSPTRLGKGNCKKNTTIIIIVAMNEMNLGVLGRDHPYGIFELTGPAGMFLGMARRRGRC